MKPKSNRIQIRAWVDQDLIETIDYEYINTGKFSSLSQVVRTAIREFLLNYGYDLNKQKLMDRE